MKKREILLALFILITLPVTLTAFLVRCMYEASLVGWNGGRKTVDWLMQ